MSQQIEHAGLLIPSMITSTFIVWGVVWAVSFFGPSWVEMPLAIIVSIYWFMGLPAPLVPWHGYVIPPLGNFLMVLLILAFWAVSLWIVFSI